MKCKCGEAPELHIRGDSKGWVCWISCRCGRTGGKTRVMQDLFKAGEEAEEIWKEEDDE
jgi:hypothetical protein